MPSKTTRTKIQKLFLARPRGFCAGVLRAVQLVEKALELYGTPLYVRHEIVHNQYVVNDFKTRGVVFVETLAQVPDGAVVVFSAHGSPPALYEEAAQRKLTVLDATCPLVSKVHTEARLYAKKGYHILLVGHKGHVEVEGTMGQAHDRNYNGTINNNIELIENIKQAHEVDISPQEARKVAVLTQTTLSVDDTAEIISVLTQRFPHLVRPKKDDICYATQNRQDAVKKLAPKVEVLLIVGAKNSSNSRRLVEVARKNGCANAYLVGAAADIPKEVLKGVSSIGLSAGASAPEAQIQSIITALDPDDIEELAGETEDTVFQLPSFPEKPPKTMNVRIQDPSVSRIRPV